MNNTLLINEINPDKRQEAHDVFFLIGDMDQHTGVLLDTFNAVDSKYYGKGKLKHNGLSLRIETWCIPEVIETIVNLNIELFGVYELYGLD
ncbi:hypothetical protein O6R05_07055 [Peptoniphilus equinus]|uniref:Uncharacterized protein n=1 Tax=Peptoniphilus equinus TaxID=3016343 RepID=A0ABY7QUJ3_9FIRM|nr:hypothetical protein [Peptoniphilus equinus]WBW49754.1 hypothetical protein O6R05_07055 [Peptoniphilus equinus]